MGKGTGAEKQLQKEMQKYEEKEAVMEEGQIKRVPFFKSNVKFDAVVGLKKAKQYLNDNIILAIRRPELFKKYGKKQGVGLLLYGPPGTGKTHIVRAIAGESGANVIIARINQIVDMYTGNTEKNLHAIFEQARKNATMHNILRRARCARHKALRRRRRGRREQLDKACDKPVPHGDERGRGESRAGIYVVGATNHPWDIDLGDEEERKVRRHSVHHGVPNYGDRKALFELYTKNAPRKGISFGRLASATMGFPQQT